MFRGKGCVVSMSRRTVLAAAAAAAVLPIPVGAIGNRNWYVDSRVESAGDGGSWATAWKRATDIRWSDVMPGDTIYFSGGTTGLTYGDTLDIRRSGEVGMPITVAAAIDPGHDGQVVFDFGSSDNYVRIRRCGHVVVSGFTLRNGRSGSVVWLRELEGGVVFSDNVIETPALDGGNARGIDIRECSGTLGTNVVLRNRITTPDFTTSQADGIYSMDNGHDALRIEGNAIYVNNTDPTGHSDCFQSYRDGSMVIVDNLFQGPTAARHNHPVWVADIQDGGLFEIRGNRCVNRNGGFNLTVWRSEPGAGRGAAIIAGNEVVGGGRALNFERNTDVSIVDNDVEPDETGFAYFMAVDAIPPGNVAGNRVYATASVASLLGETRSWEAWQRAGYDINSVRIDRYAADADADAA